MENWTLTWSKLNEINISSSLLIPSLPGVYRLSYRSSNGNIYVFYVGQADDLKARITQHLSQNEVNSCIRKMLTSYTCYIRYARINDRRIRDGAELFLYRHFSPSCNSVEPTGPEISINVG